jgi:hypothetical protein
VTAVVSLDVGSMKMLRRPRFDVILSAILLATGFCLIGGGSAQATTDLRYDCQRVISLDPLPYHMISAQGCTGPVATGYGFAYQISTGTGYWCNNIQGRVVLDTIWVNGQGCAPV